MKILFFLLALTFQVFPFQEKESVLSFTVMKSGTNLLGTLFRLLGLPHEEDHFCCLEKLEPVLNGSEKFIILIRDPRDVNISLTSH